MALNTTQHVKAALAHVSEAIVEATERVATEAKRPDWTDVDRSDEILRDGRKLVTRLREIRRELEDLTFAEYLL